LDPYLCEIPVIYYFNRGIQPNMQKNHKERVCDEERLVFTVLCESSLYLNQDHRCVSIACDETVDISFPKLDSQYVINTDYPVLSSIIIRLQYKIATITSHLLT